MIDIVDIVVIDALDMIDSKMIMNSVTYLMKAAVNYTDAVEKSWEYGQSSPLIGGRQAFKKKIKELMVLENGRMCWHFYCFMNAGVVREAWEEFKREQYNSSELVNLESSIEHFTKVDFLTRKIKEDFGRNVPSAERKKNSKTICLEYSKILSGLIFPSLAQMKPPISLSSQNRSPLQIRKEVKIVSVVPDSLVVFNSKDKPFLLRFHCTDGITRALIFKKVFNSALEPIVSNVFANGFLHSQSQAVSESFFSTEQTFYSILPITRELIILEVIDGIDTLCDYANIAKHQSLRQLNSDQDTVDLEIKCIQKDFFYRTYANLTPAAWFSRKLDLNVTMGFWWIVGAIFGIGDRNMKNIMIGPERGFVFIDFEALLGIGRELPCPETVRFRVGPLFRKFPGSQELRDLFKMIMCSYYSYIREHSTDFMLLFSEMLEHFGEKAFAAKSDFFKRKTLEEHLERFFSASKADDYEQIDTMIDTLSAPTAQAKMFEGWEPRY